MKSFVLILLCALHCQTLFAQDCKEIDFLDTPGKRAIVNDYITSCHQKHYFFEDKGIVVITKYKNKDNKECWYLSAAVDDRFRSSPPASYAWSGNDILLIYQGTSSGKPIPAANNPLAIATCLDEVIGGRVYHYEPKPQYTYVLGNNGKREKVKVTRLITGNVNNEVIIIFNHDGTLTKVYPA